MDKIKLILADDHALIRAGFKLLLGKNEMLEIVGEAENGEELIELVAHTMPDIVLADITMPKRSGLEALEVIRQKYPAVKFMILTMHEEREYITRAITAGAEAYVLKDVEKIELEKAIKTVYEGGKYFSPAIARTLAESISKPSPEQTEISPREKEVLEMVAEGHSTKVIADKLAISIRTVESHRVHLLKKLNVSNTAELIKKSIQLKLINGAQ
jgi:DNA-binding NarL/FixJ family response regulator